MTLRRWKFHIETEMTTRTKWTIAATLIILLYGFGIVWWWTHLPPDLSTQPETAKYYKSFRITGH